MPRYYAGIGSRQTPKDARNLIHEIAMRLNELDYVLRSGGADGADTFFEEAAKRSEIFLPWRGFNGRPRSCMILMADVKKFFQGPTQEAVELAQERIDGYDERSHGPRMLLARNMHQVLGEDLKAPVEFVVCWTTDGKIAGGTAYAIQLARSRDIPVYNLARERDVKALKKVVGMAPQQELF